MKTDLHIGFCDLPTKFNYKNNIFTQILSKYYNLYSYNEVDLDIKGENLDIIFFCEYGFTNCKYKNPIKIYFSFENVNPNLNICDYAFVSNKEMIDNNRVFYLPAGLFLMSLDDKISYLIYNNENYNVLNNLFDINDNNYNKYINRKFCISFISNYSEYYADPLRRKYINLIDTYKIIDKGGNNQYNNLNNIYVEDKIKFCSDYKFNLAFENSIITGYNTEKIFEAFLSYNIPIYFGDESVFDLFDENSFIYVNKYKNGELINKIKEIDTNNDKYIEMLLYKDKYISKINYYNNVKNILINIINNKKKYLCNYGFFGIERVSLNACNYYFENKINLN